MNKENDEIKYERDTDEIDENEEAEKIVHLNKRVFKEEISKVDMGFWRNTDMKTSRRIIFCLGRPVKEEAKIETRLEIWREIVKKYIEEKCKEG